MTVTEAILDETSFVLRPRFEDAKAKLAEPEEDEEEEEEEESEEPEEEVEATAARVEREAFEKLAKRMDKQFTRVLAELKKQSEPKKLEDSLTNATATTAPGWARFNALQKTT